jgi:4-amino-4-deoxy-L-arabinose transferase-like glycosyltransferase
MAFAVTSAVVARLAAVWAGDAHAGRAAVMAVALVALVPAYQLSALLMTIDAPYVACWALAVLAAWHAYVGERDGRPSPAAWLACGLAIGAGFLFKYSMLLIVPGLAWFAWRERGVARSGAGRRAAAALALATICAWPVVAWNITHQGAGVAHLLGYLELTGGDRPARAAFAYDPRWTLSLLAAQVAIIGPALALMILGWRRRGGDPAARLAASCAAPMLLAFVLASLRAPAEGNWPIAAYVSLVPLAAVAATAAARRSRLWWRATCAYGVAALIAIHAPLAAAALPAVGRFVPTIRFTGFAHGAAAIATPIEGFVSANGPDTVIVAASHNAAGLLAFYLPGRPVVASAGRFLGDRPSAYDFFQDTNLSGDALRGRPAVLIGATASRWEQALDVSGVVLLSARGPVVGVRRLAGPR